MNSLSSNRTRQALSYIVFAGVALASLVFWATELRHSIRSHNERINEVLAAHQQSQLDRKAELIRGLINETYQTGRTISLLPPIRQASGPNRRSEEEDVVRQGRLSLDTYRMLEQVFANLHASIQASEVYVVLDGFDPAKGDVPFIVYESYAGHRPAAIERSGQPNDVPVSDESEEYAAIVKHMDWFRNKTPMFRYASDLNWVPGLISPLVRTGDTTQYLSIQNGNPADARGIVFSVPIYDLRSGKFKGLVSIIVRANVFEAKLLGVPFLPVTADDQARMAAAGWKMPPPGPFVLAEIDQRIEISDRRNPVLARGLAMAMLDSAAGGRWASLRLETPVSGTWQLHHYLSEPEIEGLVAGIRAERKLSIIGRVALLVVLCGFLGWGFWLLAASRRELIKIAHYDPLTDLPNRRLFFDRMEVGIARALRNGTRMGLFFVDLAGLNAINDRHGHHGGDQLLVQVAKRLQDRLRDTDGIFVGERGNGKADPGRSLMPAKFMVSRLGGDEFTIICEDLRSTDDLAVVAERVIASVKEPFMLGDEQVEITLNVGAAQFPDDADDAERLLMSADSAMHECKQTHGHYVLFNEEMRARAERLHLLTLGLVAALNKGEFELYYQPKALLSDGRVVSLEALIRWHHPILGMVSPIEFIPILERTGGISAVGEWIVQQACRDFHRLTAAGFPELRLSVNVSVSQLRAGNFERFLKTALAESAIDAKRLILEITETMVIEDLKQGRQVLRDLAQLGVKLAIDDFGAGYSSMTYLQHLPIDYIKLDKSLIDGMLDPRSIHVVESVIRLAQGLSLTTIAEGVETEAQQVLIRRLGCDIVQGYLLSRPLPLTDIIDWLNERDRQGLAAP